MANHGRWMASALAAPGLGCRPPPGCRQLERPGGSRPLPCEAAGAATGGAAPLAAAAAAAGATALWPAGGRRCRRSRRSGGVAGEGAPEGTAGLDRDDPAGEATWEQWGGPGELVFESPSATNGVVRVFAAPGPDGGSWRRLSFEDPMVWQSVVLLGPDGAPQRDAVAFGYVKTMASVGMATARLLGTSTVAGRRHTAPLRVLCLGVGGGMLPCWLARMGAHVHAVELDPVVLEAAQAAMGLPPSAVHAARTTFGCALDAACECAAAAVAGSLRVYCCEASAFALAVAACGGHYDVVLVDVVDGEGRVPSAVTSPGFTSALGKLCRSGCAVVNMICRLPTSAQATAWNAPDCAAAIASVRAGFGPAGCAWSVLVRESHNLVACFACRAPSAEVLRAAAAEEEAVRQGAFSFDPG